MGEIRNVYYPQNEMNTVLLPVATARPRCLTVPLPEEAESSEIKK